MRKILINLLFISLALIMGIIALYKVVGYVLIVFPTVTLEVPIWFFFVLSFCLVLIFYLILKMIRWFWGISFRLHAWIAKRNALRARKNLQQALFALFATDEVFALKQLEKAEKFKADPLILNVLRLFAHQKIGNYSERDQCFENLQRRLPKEAVPIRILQARFQMQSNQLVEAQTSLEKIEKYTSYHQVVLALLASVYYQQKNNDLLGALLPELSNAVEPVLYQNYEESVVIENLSHCTDARSLTTIWKTISAVTQAKKAVLAIYIKQLLRFDLNQEAEAVVRKKIEIQFSSDLYLLYAKIKHNAVEQLAQVESWLKKHDGLRAELLFAAGQLCLRFQLWGKARDYFETSLQQKPNPEVYAQLAKLYEQLGDSAKAAECWKAGLELAVK